MIIVNVPIEEDHFSSVEETIALKEKILQTFEVPYPDSLKVSLSLNAFKKIEYCLSFIIENNINSMDFYLFSREENPIEEKVSFTPVVDHLTFDSSLYDDFDDVYFKVFKTDGGRIKLDKSKISFYFIYSNSWTEHVFKFTMKIKDLIALKQ